MMSFPKLSVVSGPIRAVWHRPLPIFTGSNNATPA